MDDIVDDSSSSDDENDNKRILNVPENSFDGNPPTQNDSSTTSISTPSKNSISFDNKEIIVIED